jgi:hypothetical protein
MLDPDIEAKLDEGTRCPHCGHWCERHWRRINDSMGRSLCWLVKAWERLGPETDGPVWVSVPDLAPRWLLKTNQLSPLRWWSFVARPSLADTKVRHLGMWRPTQDGIDYAYARIERPEYVVTYLGNVVQYSGRLVTIRDAFDADVRYEDVMASFQRGNL